MQFYEVNPIGWLFATEEILEMLEQKCTNVLLQVVRIMFCPTAALFVLVEERF